MIKGRQFHIQKHNEPNGIIEGRQIRIQKHNEPNGVMKGKRSDCPSDLGTNGWKQQVEQDAIQGAGYSWPT
jgi:hypothetical protein